MTKGWDSWFSAAAVLFLLCPKLSFAGLAVSLSPEEERRRDDAMRSCPALDPAVVSGGSDEAFLKQYYNAVSLQIYAVKKGGPIDETLAPGYIYNGLIDDKAQQWGRRGLVGGEIGANAIFLYTQEGFRQVNGEFDKTGNPSPFRLCAAQERYRRILSASIKRLPRQTCSLEAPLYHGNPFKGVPDDRMESWYPQGSVVAIPSFFSTSKSAETAAKFGTHRFKIIGCISPRDIAPHSSSSGEEEFLFLPGSRFCVRASGSYYLPNLGGGREFVLEELAAGKTCVDD